MARRGANTTAVQTARASADVAEARVRAKRARLEGQALRAVEGKLKSIIEGREERRGRSAFGGGFGGGAVATSPFENAARHRMRSGTRPTGGATWVHYTRTTRDNIRKDCFQAKCVNSVVRAIVHRHADLIVGDGAVVKPTASVGDKEQAEAWNAQVKRMFNDWAMGRDPLLGTPNLQGIATLWQDLAAVADAWLVEGDRLVCAVTDADGRTTFQWHGAESIVNKGNGWQDTETMVGGVEFHATERGPGAVKAFHVAGYEKTGTVLKQGTWELPAASCYFLPNPAGYDPRQVRGEPALQAALYLFDLTKSYIEDTAVAAQVATWLGVIFKSDKPADLQAALIAATSNQADTSGSSSTAREVEFGPGFGFTCKPGEGPVQIDPKFPTTNFKDFVLTLIQLCGADVGLPLALVLYITGDLNFSSLRGVISMSGRSVDKKQGVLSSLISWMYRLKVQEWVRRGMVSARDDWDSHTVKMPPMPVVDLKMEAEAYKLMVEFNLMTKDQAIELLGYGTFEEIVSAREAEVKRETDAGVLPATMPGAGGGPAGAKAITGTDPQDPAEKKSAPASA